RNGNNSRNVRGLCAVSFLVDEAMAVHAARAKVQPRGEHDMELHGPAAQIDQARDVLARPRELRLGLLYRRVVENRLVNQELLFRNPEAVLAIVDPSDRLSREDDGADEP